MACRWATATGHKLQSSCQGDMLEFGSLACHFSKVSVGVVEVAWIAMVVLGKNVRAVMVLFILTNGKFDGPVDGPVDGPLTPPCDGPLSASRMPSECLVACLVGAGALLWTDFIAVNLSFVWVLLLVLLVGVLVLIGQPAICEVEEALFHSTAAKVKAYKERIMHAHAAGKLHDLREELEASMPQADKAVYITVRNAGAALLVLLSALLGSEPYWLPDGASANGLCVSH